MKVRDLRPGMVFPIDLMGGDTEPGTAIFITQSRHPLWSGLQLVVWRYTDDTVGFDALDANQDLTFDPLPMNADERLAWLRRGVLGRQGAQDMIDAVARAADVNLRVVTDALDALRMSTDTPEPRRGTTRGGRPTFLCTSEGSGHRAVEPWEK